MNNLRKLRTENNELQEDVGKIIGISGRAVGNYETGKRQMSPEILLKLAEHYNVSTDYLLGNSDIKSSNTTIIPVIGTVKAGYDYLAVENIIDKIKVESSLVGDGSEYFALKLKGDSMAPAFLDGDIVIVKKQNDCENNEFAIVIINGEEGTLKKVKKTDAGIILQPLNPAYTPLIFTNEEIKSVPIIIIGIVKKLERRF